MHDEEFSKVLSLEHLLEYSLQDIEGPLYRILESLTRESSHMLLEVGGEELPKIPSSTLVSHHSHKPSLHNSRPILLEIWHRTNLG